MAESPLLPNIRRAIQRLGHDPPDSLDDVTETADVAEDFHIKALDQCLSDWDWDFASTYQVAEAADDGDDPIVKWALKWKLPEDCVLLRQVFAGDVEIHKDQDFEIGGKDDDKDGRFLMTNQSAINIRFTRREANPNNWDPNFEGVYEAKLREVLAFPYTSSLRIEQEAEAKYIRTLGRAVGQNEAAGGRQKTQYDGISSALD